MADLTDELTIDELARSAGLVASTVRLYQHRGLLPPPVRRGRVGLYGRRHLGRLRLIGQLRERGFSLAGIKELLTGVDKGESLRAVLGLGEGPAAPRPDEPESMSLGELVAQLPEVDFDTEMIRRIVDLGLVDIGPEPPEVVVRSPVFLRVGRELAALGVPPGVILDEYEKLRAETDEIASRFTEVFRAHLWEPFVQAGMAAPEMTRLIGRLEQLGPLAQSVVDICLRHSLQDAAERFVNAEAERLEVDISSPGRPKEDVDIPAARSFGPLPIDSGRWDQS